VRNFNGFAALWRAATFSKPLYVDVAHNWRGIGARYLFLLVVLTWLPVLVGMTLSMNSFLAYEAPETLKNFPSIKIVKGVASSNIKEPYALGRWDRPMFVFDPQWDPSLPWTTRAPMVMTQTELIRDYGNGTFKRYPLSSFPDMTLDRERILSWLRTIRNFMIPGGMLVLGGFSLVYRLLLALVFAAIAGVLNNSMQAGLSYRALVRLAVISMTGPLYVDALLWIMGWGGTALCLLLNAALTFVYLGYAVYAVAEAAKNPVEEALAATSPPRKSTNALRR
jgi:hypothetical protein